MVTAAGHKSLGAAAALWVAALAPLAAAPQAPPKPSPRSVKVYGGVEVTRDKEGRITAVTLASVNHVTYRVVLDEAGRKLGEEMAGKRGWVIGQPEGDGQQRSLTVQRYAVVTKATTKAATQRTGGLDRSRQRRPSARPVAPRQRTRAVRRTR